MAVAAGVVRQAEIAAAAGASVAMAAERCGAAALDGAHDFDLWPRHMRGITIQEKVAGGAQDIGDFQRRPAHFPSVEVGGSVSSGLATAVRWRLDRCTYNAESRISACPNRAWMVHRSAPASSRCVA